MNNIEDIHNEIDKLYIAQKEITNELKLGVDAYAENMKNYLGEEIKKELLNPTSVPIKIKKSFWKKLKEWWFDFKNRIDNYFFSIEN